MSLDATHDPSLRSWVASANDAGCDFPLQNLPFGRFRPAGSAADWRIGVAIGDQILDLAAAGLIDGADMQALMARPVAERRALRRAISSLLRDAAPSPRAQAAQAALVPQAQAELTLPCAIGDYTDFYTGIHHATAVGQLLRPEQPLLPNYKWVPIGYHGRSSSIAVGGQPIRRPNGQTKDAGDTPRVGPSQRLDYELELGYFIGPGNALGAPIAIAQAEEHLFGVALFNDWSARDIQAWEYQPLGPFLAKNFASSVAPWIVTWEALAPFRAPCTRPPGDPAPLPYLDAPANRTAGGIDVVLEVWLQTQAMRDAGAAAVRLSRSHAAEAAYWTPAQLVAHHTVGGCNLRPGDLLGSGTLSGPAPEQAGSLMELTRGGRAPITLPNGQTRSFLADGDTLTLRGWCDRPGHRRIGLGSCSATVLPALPMQTDAASPAAAGPAP